MSLRLLGYLQALLNVRNVGQIEYSGSIHIGVEEVDQVGDGDVGYVGELG